MGENLDDLLPLFLSEAQERLERLLQAISGAEIEPDGATAARRELHALKGATRMMGMTDLSEVCHQAEDVLDPLTEESKELLTPLVDQLTAAIEDLASGGGPEEAPEDESEAEAQPAEESEKKPEATFAGDEVRIPAKVLSQLSDRSVRCRVIANAGSTIVDSVLRLARFAEGAVNDRQPEQILASLATSLRQIGLDLDTNQRAILYNSDHQLDTLLGLQVQPIKPYLLNLARHARDLARSLGKQIEVVVEADDGQLDRRIIDALKEAFLHLVRNAVDHGIESEDVRVAAGKPKRGRLGLATASEGDRLTIVVVDDGGGMDAREIADAAVASGMIEKDDAERLSPAEQLQLICLPGFSTREQASNVSGRGVGMEAVAEAIRSVGGDIIIESQPGEGTTVRFNVPLTRRGENLLVVKVGRYHVAIPASVVRSFRRIAPGAIIADQGRFFVDLGERAIPVRAFEYDPDEKKSMILLEGEVGGSGMAMLVDEVLGEEEVFLRPLIPGLGAPEVFDSTAVLSSGRPVPVISPQRLLVNEAVLQPVKKEDQDPGMRVLLVDDSQVTREMIRRLLEDGGFAVRTASGADEALRILDHADFECVVTDIEMPEMDGLELTRHLRETPQFAHIPIIVVSTRDRPQDRLAGLEAGADAYLTKQGLDAKSLIRLVTRVGGR